MKEIVQWSAPAPLWTGITGSVEKIAREEMLQPAILRFATDSFMEDFMDMMQNDPARFGDFIALPETWRGPLATAAPIRKVPPFLLRQSRSRFLPAVAKQELMRLASGQIEPASQGGEPLRPVLKLYQPAHQRFYIVAGCLVCRQAGLPDHTVDGNRQERVTFVVRRLCERSGSGPTKEYDEYAFVTTPGNKGWQKLDGNGAQLLKDEDQAPLSPTSFAGADQRTRRIFTGLIPVSKREAYMGAAVSAPARTGATGSPTNVLPKTERKILFRKLVGEPWKRIVDRSLSVTKSITGGESPSLTQKRDLLNEAREQLQVSSWYVLLDLAKFLNEHLREVWLVVVDQSAETTLNAAQKKLFDALNNTRADSTLVNALKSTPDNPSVYTAHSVKPSLREVLKAIKNPADDWEDRLDAVTTPYLRNNSSLAAAWPPFLFPLIDPEPGVISPQVAGGGAALGSVDGVEADLDEPNVESQKRLAYAGVDHLTALVVRALPANSPKLVPEPPLASQKLLQNGEGLFVIRFVYERPLCGPLDPPEVSQPTVPFQMAGYFDPDAPARPIRISLPLDTSPAGLRKFDKNTAFAISDVLCGQIQRLRSLTFGDLVLSVLPWPFHKDLSAAAPDAGACKSGNGLEIGMICSISIPIITICALLLLIIIVNLLDIVFRWMPYFFICFPVPGLKGKK